MNCCHGISLRSNRQSKARRDRRTLTNNKLGLTETFVYGSGTDDLYRLSSSTLNSGSGPTTNLALTYDAAGNILTKNEPGIASAMIPHSATWTSYNYPSQITAGSETATFSYGPDRQRWKMMRISRHAGR